MENEKPITKDTTKEKIILFVIGVLTGAVISTGAFFAYIKLAGIGTTSGNQSMQMPGGGTPPEMPNGDQGGTPPEMPSGNNSNSTNNQSEAPNNETNSDSTNSQNSQSGTPNSKSGKPTKTQTTNS